jgi:hypothetical protein
MKLKGQLLWTDYLNSQLLHARWSGPGIIVSYGILLIMALGVLGSLYLVAVGAFPFVMMIPGIIFVILILLYRYIYFPDRVKRIFFQQKELALPFEIEVTDAGLIVSNELGHGTRPWKNFIKWKEDKELLILYHSDVLYSILPKRIFSDPRQVEMIKAHLEENKVLAAKNRSLASCVIFVILFFTIAMMLYMAFRNSINS